MRINSYHIILTIISLVVLVSNFKVFKVNVGQEKILEIVATGNYQFEDKLRNRISSGYPSVSGTAIPFKTILGAHWIINDSIDKGLKLLKESENDNPYLGFNDLLYANLFEEVGMLDSFNYYARRAVNKLPNAPQHYVLLSKIYVMENKIDSLDFVFNKIKNRVDDSQIWKVYLASVLRNFDSINTKNVLQNAELAKKKYRGNEEIRLLADYIIYGEDTITDLINSRQIAIDTFNLNKKYAIKLMEEIVDTNNDIFNNEILIEMYFRDQQFSKVIEVYDKLNTLNLTDITGTVVEFISISYVNTNNLQFGCYLAQQLSQVKYKLSNSLALACNINQ